MEATQNDEILHELSKVRTAGQTVGLGIGLRSWAACSCRGAHRSSALGLLWDDQRPFPASGDSSGANEDLADD
jgi:hypothetical protein